MSNIIATLQLSPEEFETIKNGGAAAIMVGHLGSLMPCQGFDIIIRIELKKKFFASKVTAKIEEETTK